MDGWTIFWVVLFILVVGRIIMNQIFPDDWPTAKFDTTETDKLKEKINEAGRARTGDVKQDYTQSSTSTKWEPLNTSWYEEQEMKQRVRDSAGRGRTSRLLPEKTEGSPDSFEYFGLGGNATKEQVDKAYLRKLHTVHPDKKDGSTEKFYEAQRQYKQALKDVKRRK